MKELLHAAALERRFVCDGAMGTQLMLAGLEPGGCGELWNLTHETARAVYKQLPGDIELGVPRVPQAGANIVGSCCGNTPEHTRIIRRIVSQFNRSTTQLFS